MRVKVNAFNWTKVELKHQSAEGSYNKLSAFNWTKVELKQIEHIQFFKNGGSF